MSAVLILYIFAWTAPHAGLAQDNAQSQNSSPDVWSVAGPSHKAIVDSATGIYKDGKTASTLGGVVQPEDQEEILRSMFEGKSADIRKIVTPQAAVAGAAAAASSGYLDRLSLSHLTGYSPQIQALQSGLNAQAAGISAAPRLEETGKLDYATLSYPRYVLYYDLSQMKDALNAEQNSSARTAATNPEIKKREKILSQAQAAILEFDQEALRARNPQSITVSLLQTLSAQQKEASRRISEAALLQDKSHAVKQESFFSPALYALILEAPAGDAAKRAYIQRGKNFLTTLKEIESEDDHAADLLESKSWTSATPTVAQIESRDSALNATISRYLPDYLKTPYLMDSLSRSSAAPGFWDKVSTWIFPSSLQARSLARRTAALRRLTEAFNDIAAGNMEAAHRILAQDSPSNS